MPEMLACDLGGDIGPGTPGTAWPSRLLESPEGVVHLYDSIESSGVVRGGARLWSFTLDERPFRLWYLKNLCWSRTSGLKILQGNSLQRALGPRYLVVDANIRPVYHPNPGLDALYVAEPLFPVQEEELGVLTVRLYEVIRPVLSSL